MTSKYPILGNRPIDQWKVTELKEELKKRKLPTKGLKDDLIKRLHESMKAESSSEVDDTTEPLNSQSQESDKQADTKCDESDKNVSQECNVPVEILNTNATDLTKDVSSENFSINIAEEPNHEGETAVEVYSESKPEFPIEDTQKRVVMCDLNTVEADDAVGNSTSFVPILVPEEGNISEEHNRNGRVPANEESKDEMMTVEPKSVPEEDELKHSPATNQVSEVNQNLGVCDSVSADSVSIIEKNELKSNDTVELEIDVVKPEKNESVDFGDSEKLNLDRSSGDESEEEMAVDFKQVNKNNDTHLDHNTDALTNTKIIADEGIKLNVLEKRKLHGDDSNANTQPPKKQPRWNSDVNVPTDTRSSPPNGAPMRVVSRSDVSTSDETKSERIVPPSQNPPTSSLKIDRFLRPFTLKAVQELLERTGAVEKFWMDSIKTHCFVSYGSVEEATATRDALYNLQWPANGGRNLTVEFVEAEEVLTRLENPGKASESVSGQQQVVQRQRVSSPPPPPAVKEKEEAPIVTLDDLFRKTSATPRIYYLPLSEEQVSCKHSGNSDAVMI